MAARTCGARQSGHAHLDGHPAADERAGRGRMTWLTRNWQYAGAVTAAVLLLLSPVWLRFAPFGLAIVCLQLPVYMLHQVEEHHHDAFRAFFNLRLGGGREALTPRAVLVINLVGVWLVDVIAIYLATFVDLSWGLVAVYLAVVNGLVHLGAGIAFREYNPGLISGLVLFLGFGGWSAVTVSSLSDASMSVHIVALLVAVGTHAAILVHVRRRLARLERST